MNEEEKETKLVEVKNEGKKKTKLRDIFILQIVIAIYTLSTVCAKFASGQEFMSFQFILYYGLEMMILGVYAIVWQQLIKKFEISVAYAEQSYGAIMVNSLGNFDIQRYSNNKKCDRSSHCNNRNNDSK